MATICYAEDDANECLPLTSSGGVEVLDSIRALADRAQAQCISEDDVHNLLKQVVLLYLCTLH